MYQTCTTYELYCLMYQMLKHLLVVSYTVYLFTSKSLSRVLIGFSILDYRTGYVWKHYHQVNILISYVLVLLLNTIPFVGNNQIHLCRNRQRRRPFLNLHTVKCVLLKLCFYAETKLDVAFEVFHTHSKYQQLKNYDSPQFILI